MTHLFSFVLVLGLVITSVAKGANPDLLVWYKFDETSGSIAHDSSGNGHDGTLNGDPKWVPGQINGALDFGGDDDYVIDDDAGEYMNGLSALTVALWIKSDVTGTDSGFIIFEAPSGVDDRDIRYDADGGGGDLNLIKYGITSTGGNPEDESSRNVQTTDWQHIAMVWSSGNQLELYINGVLDTPTEIAAAATGTLTGYDMVMVGKGGKDESATEGWDGLVDDVRIYGRVLTAEEI
ncbi:MAG: LamG domain-containing protein, partial [Planctomycetota bacterium]